MQLIYRVSAVLCLCVVLGYLQAEEVFSHKDWSVTTYSTDPKYIKYTTHGSAVWGHEFGFLKKAGNCDEDNIYVSWSSTVDKNQLENMLEREVLFDLEPDNAYFQFAVPHLVVNPLMEGGSLNIMLFTNYFPQFTFKPTLEVGKKISVKVNDKDPHHKNFDIPYDEFSLEGYIAARQYAIEQCENRTKALKIINEYKTAQR